MKKTLMASKKVMKNYLSELLTDPDIHSADNIAKYSPEASIKKVTPDKKITVVRDKRSLENLLKTVNQPRTVKLADEVNSNDTSKISPTSISSQKRQIDNIVKSSKSYRQGDFQAMYFDVAGLIIAVPLIELGGIHKVNKTNTILAKPDWFKGVMLHRDEKINVVDTALWVMPEKCNKKLMASLNYEYIIMLNDSSWGLMAENLVDTVVLKQEEVKWLDETNKRPWLAGLVKEKMCALLDVNALITLLDEGSNIHNNN
jgi:purine-binding chemotaxis protein CheW